MRTGITYFYCKRKVLDDGIHTDALDITSTPRKNLNLIINLHILFDISVYIYGLEINVNPNCYLLFILL